MNEDKDKSEDVVAVQADEPEGVDEPRGTGFALNVQGSTLAASAQGPGAQSHGTVINNYGPSKSDIRYITREVVLALREAVGQAQDRNTDDMLRVSFAVARGLVAAKLGAEPDDTRVAEFLRAAVEDPAFPARAARLFQEGAKTPSDVRRRLLASALFGIPSSTPERDRIDAAIEKLFPPDVRLLADLIRFALPKLLLAEGENVSPFIVREEDRHDMLWKQTLPSAQLICDAYALRNLQSAGGIEIVAKTAGFGPERRYTLSAIFILPLGHALHEALKKAGLQGIATSEHDERQK